MIRLRDKILAWSVHVFTSLGLLAAFMAIISVDQKDWRGCFLWLFVCFIIDSVDGTFARKLKVKEILPNMDGKNIDYIIDFASYALIPAFFFYKAEMVSAQLMLPTLAIILLSSALYYGKEGMVEDEQYFIGFPVLWNFVVFFQFFVFDNHQLLNFISVIILGILHFVPLKFAYPSRSKRYFLSHLFFSVFGLIGALALLINYPESNILFVVGTVVSAVYFFGFAVFDTLKN